MCEEEERKLQTRDCGLYTPNGFIDQWAVEIHGKPGQSSQACPEDVITGTPPTNLVNIFYYFFILNKCLFKYFILNSFIYIVFGSDKISTYF